MNDMAKIFWSGRSQAVRLPKEYRFEGNQVRIHREGDKVILEPAQEDGWAWIRSIQGLDDDAARFALERPRPGDPESVIDDDPCFD